VYEEKHQFKKSKEKERKAEKQEQNKDPQREFDVVVKAKNPKFKVSTVVP